MSKKLSKSDSCVHKPYISITGDIAYINMEHGKLIKPYVACYKCNYKIPCKVKNGRVVLR